MVQKKQYNSSNEIIKTKFFNMLENAKGRDPKTIQSYANAIQEFEIFTNFADFKKFTIIQAIEFKKYLANKKNQRTGENISKSYLQHYIAHLRDFFEYLSRDKTYSKCISYDDSQYFTISRNDRNRAMATGFQEGYEISEIILTIRSIEAKNVIAMRDKAMISLTLLTTPRISALQTARIGSIKYFKAQDTWAFIQNPNYVNTKFARQINAYFIGNITNIYDNVLLWKDYLLSEGFGGKDPLFPRIMPGFDKNNQQVLVLERRFIKSQTTIREIFKRAFENNDLPYHKPHSFRHSIVRKALNSKNSPQLISALHQNMGHSMNVGVILDSYGTSPEHKRGIILKEMELE